MHQPTEPLGNFKDHPTYMPCNWLGPTATWSTCGSEVIQQERLVHHSVEQLVEVPVHIPQETIVQVPKIAVQESWT